jgi:hypothetical protein
MKIGKIILGVIVAGLIAVLLTIAILKRGFYETAQQVADATKPETVTIHKNPEQNHIYYLTIEGWGDVTGDAEISLIEGGNPYRTEKLSGEFTFRWDTEWYADQAEVRYTPSSVTSGTVWLRYRFKDQGIKPFGADKE